MKDENPLQRILKVIQLCLKLQANKNGQDKHARPLRQRCHTGIKLKLRDSSELKQSVAILDFILSIYISIQCL